MESDRIPLCRSIFAESALTQERYTSVWIKLINQLEKSKDTVAVH